MNTDLPQAQLGVERVDSLVLDDETGLQKIDPNEKSTIMEGREKFLSCMFMDGALKSKYSK